MPEFPQQSDMRLNHCLIPKAYNKAMDMKNLGKNTHAFTLIELSIVLVIIGLMIGGVLMGRDLIQAARVRVLIKQVEHYNAAIYTFRTKYGGMPGDLSAAAASGFGMTTRAGTIGHGNGDGILQHCDGEAESTHYYAGCETLLFWSDLSYAQLVDGAFTGTDTDVSGLSEGQLSSYFPAAKIGNGNYFFVYYEAVGMARQTNSFIVTGMDLTGTEYSIRPRLTVGEAYNLDLKMDDGYPSQGHVRGAYNMDYFGFNGGGVARCTELVANPRRYNLAARDTQYCQTYISIK